MEICIVPYSDAYKAQVFSFTDRCFQELGKRFEPDGRHSFYNDIPQNFAAFWCLLANGTVAGTAALKDLGNDTAELKALYLSGELRGQGLGKKLLREAIRFARETGFRTIVLDSMSQYTAALKLYRKAGFQPTERFNDNPYADVFMKLEL
ncbi:MAG: GNAT family N-acetyltransferase [Oscillospiraceae bacterium]|nr:GNAT family N-acetyltransferase [Oscillospiraceae bacterium]